MNYDGRVSSEIIGDISSTLKAFRMARRMRNDFTVALNEKLQKLKVDLVMLSTGKIEVSDFFTEQTKSSIERVYKELARAGEQSLDYQSYNFHVGATKILHFLFQEFLKFLIMIDSRVANVLKKHYSFNYESGTWKNYSFDKYIRAIRTYREELESWVFSGKTLQELVSYDTPPTTIPRILDKCAYVT